MFMKAFLERSYIHMHNMHNLIQTLINLIVYAYCNQKIFRAIHNKFHNAKIHCKNKGQAIVLEIFEILVFIAIFIFCSADNVKIQ